MVRPILLACSQLEYSCKSRAVLNDERTYPDPLTFNPDRFIKDGNVAPEAAFGYGRRIWYGFPSKHFGRPTLTPVN